MRQFKDAFLISSLIIALDKGLRGQGFQWKSLEPSNPIILEPFCNY